MKRGEHTQLQAQLTPCSGNVKTGPIPVTGSAESTCPLSCSFFGKGCYAEQHHLGSHWMKVSTGERGSPWEEFCNQVAALPRGLARHNQFGDLPGYRDKIDRPALDLLIDANAAGPGDMFTYSHKPVTSAAISRMNNARESRGLARLTPTESRELVRDNRAAIADANARGFTVNVSCDSAAEVDQAWCEAWPVVVVVPIGSPLVSYSPGGRKIVLCPATTKNPKPTPEEPNPPVLVDCKRCGLCSKRGRSYAIGFPAHGAMRKKVSLAVVQG